MQPFTPCSYSPLRYHYPEHDQTTINQVTAPAYSTWLGSPKVHQKSEVTSTAVSRLNVLNHGWIQMNTDVLQGCLEPGPDIEDASQKL